MEKTYIVHYTYPLRYRGTYVVKAKYGFEVGPKIAKFLHEKYGVVEGETESSTIMEIYDSQLIFVG